MFTEERECDCGKTVVIEWDDDGNPTALYKNERHICEHVAGFELPPWKWDIVDDAEGGGFMPRR
jgi:hypothetical protein